MLLFLYFLTFLLQCVVGQFIFHPTPVSSIDLKNKTSSVGLTNCISEDEKYAFVASTYAGTHIIDLNNMLLPQIVAVAPSQYSQQCTIRSNILYVGDNKEGLIIFDVKTKTAPKRLSVAPFAEGHKPSIQFVLLSPDTKYLFAASQGFIFTYLITDPLNPVLLPFPSNFVFAPNSYTLRFDTSKRFIALSNHISGITILDIGNVNSQYIRAMANPGFVIWDVGFTPDSKAFFAIDAYIGLFYADPAILFDDTKKGLVSLTYEPLIPVTESLMMSMVITSDGNYLLIGSRSTGIKLYQLNKQNYRQLTFIQLLEANYMALTINFSSHENSFIYVSNGISLIIFQAVKPNINQDYPNLFNTFQSSLTPVPGGIHKLGLACTKNEVIVSVTDSAVTIYDTTDPFYPTVFQNSIPKGAQDNLSQVTVTDDFNTLLVAWSLTGLMTYDISDKANPKFKNQYQVIQGGQIYNQITSAVLSRDRTKIIVGNSFYGILVYMFVNPADLTQLMLINAYQNEMACGFERCDLTSDGTKIACACREIGTIFLELGPPANPIINKYIYNEIAAEQVIISQNEQLLFVCNGFQGLSILDISDFFNPKKLSQLVLQGWASSLIPIFNERYIILSQVEVGQITLINIEDPKNPYEQQRVQFTGETGTNQCLSKSKSTDLFYLGSQGLRYMPILPSITIHTQFQVEVTDNSGNFLYYQTLEEGQQLLVGQSVRIIFTQLYSEQNIQVNDVKYYRHFEKQILPSWITFLPSQGVILIVVNKLGAYNDFSTETKGENILILEVQQQITASSFVNTPLKIDSTLSSVILSLLQQNGFVDFNGYVTSQFDPQVPFDCNFVDGTTYTQAIYGSIYKKIQNFIKKSLTFSKIEYPIRFFIVSSLQFNLSKSTRRLELSNLQSSGSSSDIIQTPSQQISILMQITANGKFVKKIFEGVLASFSDDLTSVKISGQTSFVNTIMKNSIQISNSTTDLSQVSITFILSDSNNYDQTIQTSLGEVGFASIHKPVYLKKSLQDQFERYYPSGNVPIEDRFQFAFDSASFQQDDGISITYTAYILHSDGKTNQILTGSWIDFNGVSLGFSGIRTASYFYSTTWIRIIADDGYSQASADFRMTFNLLPFFYAFQLIVSVLGPILGIVGFWKYRYQIHLTVAERKIMYRSETAITGQLYRKQIILYGNVQQDGIELWNLLKKQEKNLEKQIQQEYALSGSIDIYVILEKLEKIYNKNSKNFLLVDPREFDFEDSRMVRTIKRLAYECVLHKNKNTIKVLNILKDYAMKNFSQKDWYKHYLEINPIMQIVNNQVVHKQIKHKTQEQAEVDQNRNDIISSSCIETNNVRFRDQQKQTSLQKIELQNENFGMKSNEENEFVIGGNSARMQPISSKRDQKQNINSENEFFKEKGKEQNTGKDQNSHKVYINLNPFPEINVKQQLIYETLKQLNCNVVFDFNLLAEIIALDASGALIDTPSDFNPAQGESIHAFPHDLITLQAFRKNKKTGCLQSILSFLNMSYSSIGLVANDPLPKWLNYQILDGIIHIWGVPQPSDEAEILIRVINTMELAIYSYHIFIQDAEGNDMRNKTLLRKYTINYNPSSRRQGQAKMMHSSVNITSQQNIVKHWISKVQSSEGNQDSPNTNTRLFSQQNLGQKSQFAVELPLKSPTLDPNNLHQIDEEKPSVLKEYNSNLQNDKNFEKKISVVKDSSIILEMGSQSQKKIEDKDEEQVQQQS